MLWRILGHYFMSEKTRIKVILNLLIESALTRESQEIEIKLSVTDINAERVMLKHVAGNRWEATLGKEKE